MKGEYVESKNDNTSSMFAKLHPHHHHHHHHPHHQNFPPQPLHHHFQFSRECQTNSEEEDTSRSSGGGGPTTTTATTTPPATATTTTTKSSSKASEHGDGATIEVVRRPRGRPPGSKNKPKPPVIITREPEPAMSPYILEVPGGADIIETIARFSRRRSLGLCVLTGSGTVANVTLRQPTTTPGSTVTFHGRFDILSLSATFLHPTTSSHQLPSSVNNFTISLAGPQGQIVGGAVAGPLLAAGTVFVIAASFSHPSYHRLPVEEEALNSVSGGNENQSPPASGGGDSGHTAAGESGGMSMYSCHLPSDVIWAPTARQPPPPPPY